MQKHTSGRRGGRASRRLKLSKATLASYCIAAVARVKHDDRCHHQGEQDGNQFHKGTQTTEPTHLAVLCGDNDVCVLPQAPFLDLSHQACNLVVNKLQVERGSKRVQLGVSETRDRRAGRVPWQSRAYWANKPVGSACFLSEQACCLKCCIGRGKPAEGQSACPCRQLTRLLGPSHANQPKHHIQHRNQARTCIALTIPGRRSPAAEEYPPSGTFWLTDTVCKGR